MVISVPLIVGSTALSAGSLTTPTNYPILPITTTFDKPIVGAFDVSYWRNGHRWRHHHRWHRHCWRGPRGYLHCRRW